MYLNDCSGALNQLAHCQTANGQPSNVVLQRGTATPEGAVVGVGVGYHQFWDSVGAKMYVFNGTVGQNTGWVALN